MYVTVIDGSKIEGYGIERTDLSMYYCSFMAMQDKIMTYQTSGCFENIELN
jgi:hypothetical protein